MPKPPLGEMPNLLEKGGGAMYVKLFTQILDSSIADNRKLRHFFTDLLLCADAKGFVMMTEAALARRTGASFDEVLWGLSELQKPDHHSKTPDAKGARIELLEGVGYGWRIINFEHYRSMKDADQLREATRERVRRHRAKKASNAVVTKCNTGNANTEADTETEAKAVTKTALPTAKEGEVVDDFDQFWIVYPRKQGKQEAMKAWKKQKPNLTTVLEALEPWLKSHNWTKGNGQFVPMAATWINGKRWEDEAPNEEGSLFDPAFNRRHRNGNSHRDTPEFTSTRL